MTEIPALKSWIHHVTMEGIVNALVDPGKLDVCGRGPSSVMKSASTKPKGVIFRLDALALSVIATATWLAGWLGGWLAGCHTPVLYQNR